MLEKITALRASPRFYMACIAIISVLTVLTITLSQQISGPAPRLLSLRLDAGPRSFIEAEIEKPISIVSIVRIDDGYLLATYAKVFHFRSETATLREMNPIGKKGRRIGEDRHFPWVPTGLDYDTENNRLYVANYQGNNILIMEPDFKEDRLILREVVSTPDLISPENVAISSNKNWLISSNYDGNSVIAFHLDGQSWKKAWSLPLQWAHGVTILRDRVYVSGLGQRVIVEIELETGKELRRKGGFGWDPGRTEFLWPTSLTAPGDGRLYVSDAHTGRISIIRLSDLSVEKYFGANGPGWNRFNMPYALSVADGRLLIGSTFQSRVLELDIKTETVVSDTVFRRAGWDASYGRNAARAFVRRPESWSQFDGYTWKHSPIIKVAKVEYQPVYRTLNATSTISAPRLRLGTGIFGGGGYYYINAATSGQVTIFTSPQLPTALMYTRRTIDYVAPLCGKNSMRPDAWAAKNRIYTPEGIIEAGPLAAKMNGMIERLNAKRDSDGMLKKGALYDVFFADCFSRDTFHKRFRKNFTSDPGRRFLKMFERWSEGTVIATDVQKAARIYMKKMPNELEVSLDEFAMVQMLTNVPGTVARQGLIEKASAIIALVREKYFP